MRLQTRDRALDGIRVASGRLCVVAVLFVAAGGGLEAQSNPAYVQFTPAAVKGALYRPDAGAAPRVAVLLLHRTANFLSHLATAELARRGFLVLAMNPRSDNNEAAVHFEDNALDLKAGLEFLRRQPGISTTRDFRSSHGPYNRCRRAHHGPRPLAHSGRPAGAERRRRAARRGR